QVFFIALSGGIALYAGSLFTDNSGNPDPLISITGQAELDIGEVTVGGKATTQFNLTASGTIKVIKIGNIASGAASFVLQTANDLSSISFWGVAAFQTNFDFLKPYGIYLDASALLEINTTNVTQTATLSLAGIP